MFRIWIVSATSEPSPLLVDCVERDGISWYSDGSNNGVLQQPTDAVILDLTTPTLNLNELIRRGNELQGPMVAALDSGLLAAGPISGVVDFIVCPWQAGELSSRIRWLRQDQRQIAGTTDVIRAGELVIDPERYEVFLGGKLVLLTFKEYELLKLLAKNPGKVFKRDHLLNKVWEYDYFGGTRTVDVHVRRLRSKIETGDNTFIETVWNVGYRFRVS